MKILRDWERITEKAHPTLSQFWEGRNSVCSQLDCTCNQCKSRSLHGFVWISLSRVPALNLCQPIVILYSMASLDVLIYKYVLVAHECKGLVSD